MCNVLILFLRSRIGSLLPWCARVHCHLPQICMMQRRLEVSAALQNQLLCCRSLMARQVAGIVINGDVAVICGTSVPLQSRRHLHVCLERGNRKMDWHFAVLTFAA